MNKSNELNICPFCKLLFQFTNIRQ
ncbi:Cas8a1 family CRISPR/Cas system-associated protein [Paraflavisolibacter sp. H34]